MPEQKHHAGATDNIVTDKFARQVKSEALVLRPSTGLLDGQSDSQEYINALVLNRKGEALVLEKTAAAPARGVDWRVLHGWLQEKEDPLTAVQRHLQQLCGGHSSQWFYLGSYHSATREEKLVGHLFFARSAHTKPECTPQTGDYSMKWLPLRLLRYGLIDGRISKSSCALTVSLSLLTLLDLQ